MRKIIALITISIMLLSIFPCSAAVPLSEDKMVVNELVNATFDEEGINVGSVAASSLKGGLEYKTDAEGTFYVEDINGDNALKISYTDNTKRAWLYTPSSISKKGAYRVSFDFMMPTLYTQKLSPQYRQVESGEIKWYTECEIKINLDGTITSGDTTFATGITANSWYSVSFTFDPYNDTLTYADGDGNTVVKELTSGFHEMQKIEILPGVNNTLYLNDFKVEMIADLYTAQVCALDNDGNETEKIDYDNPSVCVKFSEAINESTMTTEADTGVIPNIGLYLGEELIDAELSISDDKKVISIAPESTLLPNTEYTVKIGAGLKTVVGAYDTDGSSYSIFTEKIPFGIDSAVVSEGDITSTDEFKVKVVVNNRNLISYNNVLLAVCYDDNGALSSVNAIEAAANIDKEEYFIPLKAAEADSVSKIKVLFIKNLGNQTVIDAFEIQ